MNRAMKNSGIEWVGDIPDNWTLKRAKGIFAQRNSKGNQTPVLLSSTQKQGMMPQHMLEGVVQTSADTDLQSFKTVHINDYVISLRSFQGGFEKSNFEGVCSPAYQVFYNRVPIDYNYYWLLFKSIGFISKINSLTVGIREGKNIQYKDFANMYIPFPPVAEQQAIADFLDKKCCEIDELIALQEKIIEELKAYKQSVITEAVTKGLNPDIPMKDSGIEWIGQIPENWKVERLKNEGELHGRIGWNGLRSDEFEEKSYAYLVTGQDFIQSEIDWGKCYQIRKERYDEDEFIQLHDGEILITKDGSIGKIAIVANMDKPACLNSGIFVFRQHRKTYYPKYLYWLFVSPILKTYNDYINLGGTTIIHLYQNVFERMPILIPPIGEQQTIADYLDTKCAEIDNLIAIKQSKIEELKEYKKSIIYECVTGKKDVI
jgi:type I restriction enzyme S subunit